MRTITANRERSELSGWFVLATIMLVAMALITAPGCMFAAGAAAGAGAGYAVGHEQGEDHADVEDDDD